MGFLLAAVVAWQAPQALRNRSILWRRALAAVSAVAGATAGVKPTGWLVTDVGLPAALGAAAVVFGFRAKPATVAAVAVATAAATTGSEVQPLALAAAGLALATASTARRGPTATALVGLGIVQSLLRLDLPADLPHGTSAVLAGLLLVPLAVSGYRRMRRDDQRNVRRVAFVGLAVTAVLAGIGALAVADARAPLERGVARAGAGLDAARKADQQAAQSALDDAEKAFERADATLSAPWVRPALAVPLVAQHVRVLGSVATSGVELAAAGTEVAGAANLDGLTIANGRVPLDVVRGLEEPLDGAERALRSSRQRLESNRSDWLIPSIRRRLDRQLERLGDAQTTTAHTNQALGLMPDLLGAGGSRRWFLAVMTPVEGRAAGGFMGNFGEVTATDGSIELTRFGRLAELNTGGVPVKTISGPADYLARYGRFEPEVTWQNVTMSPDFPTVARVIGEMYPQSGGQPVDGVIGIDPTGLAALLRLTGPVEVAGWPEAFSADNVERILYYEQYVRFQTPERVDLLGEAAEVIFRRLTSMTLPPARTVLDAVGPAVAGRHLQIASLRPKEADVLDILGVDGSFPPVDGDFLSVVTQNGSGSKIEWFLQRAIDYEATVAPDGRIEASAAVRLTNTAPAEGLPGYLIGGAAAVPEGGSRLYVSIYSPWDLNGARVNGTPATIGTERELNRWVYSTFLEITAGATVTLEVDLSGRVAPGRRGDDYRLMVHHQPTVTPDELAVTVNGVTVRREVSADTVVRPL